MNVFSGKRRCKISCSIGLCWPSTSPLPLLHPQVSLVSSLEMSWRLACSLPLCSNFLLASLMKLQIMHFLLASPWISPLHWKSQVEKRTQNCQNVVLSYESRNLCVSCPSSLELSMFTLFYLMALLSHNPGISELETCNRNSNCS